MADKTNAPIPGQLALMGAVIFLIGVVAYCFPYI